MSQQRKKRKVQEKRKDVLCLEECVDKIIEEGDSDDIRRVIICEIGKARFLRFATSRIWTWVNAFRSVDKFLDGVFRGIMDETLRVNDDFVTMIRHQGFLNRTTIIPFLERFLTEEEKKEIDESWTKNLLILCAKLMGNPIDSKKKRSLELKNLKKMDLIFVTLCGFTVPVDVMLHILSWVPNEKRFLDNISCICTEFYVMSLRSWRKLEIKRDVNMIPIPVLQGLKTIEVIGGSLLKKDFLTMFKYAKKLDHLKLSIGNQHNEACLFNTLRESTPMENLRTIELSSLSWMKMDPKVVPIVNHLFVKNQMYHHYRVWDCSPETVKVLKQLTHLTFLNDFTGMRKELKDLEKLWTLTLEYGCWWDKRPATWSFLKGYPNLETLEVVIVDCYNLLDIGDVCVWLGKNFRIPNLTLIFECYNGMIDWTYEKAFEKIDKEAITINYEQVVKDFRQIKIVFKLDILHDEQREVYNLDDDVMEFESHGLKEFREKEEKFKKGDDVQKCFVNYKVVSKKVGGSYDRADFICILE